MPPSKEGLPNPLITNPILFIRNAHLVPVIALCGIIVTIASPIMAQGDKPLVLQKGDEVVVIPAGDWVAAVDATGNKVLGTGRYQGIVNGTLVFKESLAGTSFKGWWRPLKSLRYLGTLLVGRDTTWVEHHVQAGEIGVLFHGEAMRTPYYTKGALNISLRAGAILGGGYVILIPTYGIFLVLTSKFFDKNKIGYFLLSIPFVAVAIPLSYSLGVFMGTYFTGLFVLPIGVATGLMRHAAAEQYATGPGQWEMRIE